jgi:hypothetical protein
VLPDQERQAVSPAGRDVAAVDPSHAHAKPAALDRRIVDTAEETQPRLRGSLHIMHASYPSIVGADRRCRNTPCHVRVATLTFEELQDQERRTFEEFSRRGRHPAQARPLVDGNPVCAISSSRKSPRGRHRGHGRLVALEFAACIHSATRQNAFLGTLPCDVLVVKPEKAASRVATRTRGLRVAASLASMVS